MSALPVQRHRQEATGLEPKPSTWALLRPVQRGGEVISDFYNGGRYHSSSVTTGANNTVNPSGCTRPGAWSYASALDTWYVDEAYDNFCD